MPEPDALPTSKGVPARPWIALVGSSAYDLDVCVKALGLLVQAVHLDGGFAPAHAALAEMYAVRGDYQAAWHHARLAEQGGEPRAVELLKRYAVAEG